MQLSSIYGFNLAAKQFFNFFHSGLEDSEADPSTYEKMEIMEVQPYKWKSVQTLNNPGATEVFLKKTAIITYHVEYIPLSMKLFCHFLASLQT